MEQDKVNMSDHDLVIRIDTRLEDLIKTVAEIRDGTHARISCLETKVDNHDKEISDLRATRTDFRQKIADMKLWDKTLIWLIIFLAGLLIWHLTGYHL